MQKMREEVFVQIFRSGAIRTVTMHLSETNHAVHATISFVTLEGLGGTIYTKRGLLKQYRVDTAMRFLRQLGLASVTVDMSHWHIDQAELAL